MESEHFIGKVAQKAVIVRDNRVLAVLDIGDSKWNLPGGRLHRGEMPKDGLAREIREELGVEVVIGEPLHADAFVSDTIGPHFSVFYKAALVGDGAFTLQPDEIAEARWLAADELGLLWEDCQAAARLALTV